MVPSLICFELMSVVTPAVALAVMIALTMIAVMIAFTETSVSGPPIPPRASR